MKRGRNQPVNSLGKPYADGDVWRCLACAEVGPDRDDVGLSDCPTGRRGAAPHDSVYTTAGVSWRREWDAAAETWVKRVVDGRAP